MMTTKEVAIDLVKTHKSLIGKKQKTPFGYLSIEAIKPIEWGNWSFLRCFPHKLPQI